MQGPAPHAAGQGPRRCDGRVVAQRAAAAPHAVAPAAGSRYLSCPRRPSARPGRGCPPSPSSVPQPDLPPGCAVAAGTWWPPPLPALSTDAARFASRSAPAASPVPADTSLPPRCGAAPGRRLGFPSLPPHARARILPTGNLPEPVALCLTVSSPCPGSHGGWGRDPTHPPRGTPAVHPGASGPPGRQVWGGWDPQTHAPEQQNSWSPHPEASGPPGLQAWGGGGWDAQSQCLGYSETPSPVPQSCWTPGPPTPGSQYSQISKPRGLRTPRITSSGHPIPMPRVLRTPLSPCSGATAPQSPGWDLQEPPGLSPGVLAPLGSKVQGPQDPQPHAPELQDPRSPQSGGSGPPGLQALLPSPTLGGAQSPSAPPRGFGFPIPRAAGPPGGGGGAETHRPPRRGGAVPTPTPARGAKPSSSAPAGAAGDAFRALLCRLRHSQAHASRQQVCSRPSTLEEHPRSPAPRPPHPCAPRAPTGCSHGTGAQAMPGGIPLLRDPLRSNSCRMAVGRVPWSPVTPPALGTTGRIQGSHPTGCHIPPGIVQDPAWPRVPPWGAQLRGPLSRRGGTGWESTAALFPAPHTPPLGDLGVPRGLRGGRGPAALLWRPRQPCHPPQGCRQQGESAAAGTPSAASLARPRHRGQGPHPAHAAPVPTPTPAGTARPLRGVQGTWGPAHRPVMTHGPTGAPCPRRRHGE